MADNKKVVVQIDVETSKFDAFISRFDKFRQQLETSPEAAKRLVDALGGVKIGGGGSGIGGSSGSSGGGSASLDALNTAKARAKSTKDEIKLGKDKFDQDKEFMKKRKAAENEANSGLFNFAKNVAVAGFALRDIKSVIGGAIGIYTGTAAGAGADRRASQGLGVTSAQLNAAKNNLSPIVDAESFLGNIQANKTDINKHINFARLGINDYDKKDNFQLSAEVIRKIKKDMDAQGGYSAQNARTYGYDQFMSADELQRLSKMKAAEVDKLVSATEAQAKKLAISDKDQEKFQDVMRQFANIKAEAFVGIQKAFSTLTPLILTMAGGIEKMVSFWSRTNFFGANESDQNGENAATIEAQKTVEGGDQNANATWMKNPNAGWKYSGGANTAGAGKAMSLGKNGRLSPQQLVDLAASTGISSGVSPQMLAAQMLTESGGDPNAMAKTSSATGLTQFIKGTANRFGYSQKDMLDPKKAAKAQAMYMKYLMKRYGGDQEKAFAAYHDGEGAVDKDIKQLGNNWRSGLTKEGQGYYGSIMKHAARTQNVNVSVNSNVTINDQTGGNISVVSQKASGS